MPKGEWLEGKWKIKFGCELPLGGERLQKSDEEEKGRLPPPPILHKT